MHMQAPEGLLTRLVERYGEVMTSEDIACVLRYRSAAAVRQAYAAGRLPVKLFKIGQRRQLFAYAEDVARLIERSREVRTPENSGR